MTTPGPAALTGDALVRLMWLASPALPVGGFSYSEVLEAAIDSGAVRDEAGTRAWLLDQLRLTAARADLPLVAQGLHAWRTHDVQRLHALNDWVRQTRESSELRQQTEQMGRSLLDWLRQRAPAEIRVATLSGLRPAPTWPVAFALAAVMTGAPDREALLAQAFGWAENLVQAALKAVPLGQSAGQRILGALADEIPAVVDGAMGCADADRQAFSPMLAILSARHESQYSRLFRS